MAIRFDYLMEVTSIKQNGTFKFRGRLLLSVDSGWDSGFDALLRMGFLVKSGWPPWKAARRLQWSCLSLAQ